MRKLFDKIQNSFMTKIYKIFYSEISIEGYFLTCKKYMPKIISKYYF